MRMMIAHDAVAAVAAVVVRAAQVAPATVAARAMTVAAGDVGSNGGIRLC
jgi:hypothetical protein